MNYKPKTRKGHSFLIARGKKNHNYICQIKITKKLILHFIREPNEVRKYNTNVDMSSAIQVNVSSHYATVANGGKVTIGSIASQDTW